MGFECRAEFNAWETVKAVLQKHRKLLHDAVPQVHKIVKEGARMLKSIAIVLAAGRGARMGGRLPKQFQELRGKPTLYYALKAFEESRVDSILLVAGRGHQEYCRTHIVARYGFQKVKAVVEGGDERHDSVYQGLLAAQQGGYELVLIHDGARPFVDTELISRLMDSAAQSGASVAGVPSKDTVKIVNDALCVVETPDRDRVWQVQTPQVFRYSLIREAYDKLMKEKAPRVTDDAMVLEQMIGHPVQMVMGDYRNIKITTPEDLTIAEAIAVSLYGAVVSKGDA